MSQAQNPYPLPAFHFTVIFGAPGVSDTAFQEVSGIGPEIQTEDVVEGGENRFVHRLPKGIKHPKLTLKRGLALADSPLVEWCRKCLESDFGRPIEPAGIDVRLLNEERAPVAAWRFENAYPVHWEIESFNSMKNEVAIEKIELSYTYCVRQQ